MRRNSVAALALTALTACSTPDETVVDPFDTTVLRRLQLTEQAQLRGGAGADEYVLHQVSGAVVLSTGEVAVTNANSEILVFGPDGDLRRTLGRSGGGPGEFRFLLNVVGLDDDRILAWDPAQARVTVFRQDGGLDYVSTPQGVDLAQIGGGFVGAFGDGRFVLEGRSSLQAGATAASGLRSDTIRYLLFDQSGAFVRTIGQFVRHERYYSANSGYERYLLDTSVHAVIAGGELLVGESDSIVLTRLDSSGATRSRLSLERTPRRVTERDIEAGWREWVERRAVAQEQMLGQAMMTLDEEALLAMRERIRASVEDELAEARRTIEPARSLPAYKSIMVGSDGALWVEDYLSPTMDVSRWIRMDAAFSPVGWIELGSNERFLTAGPDNIVILRKDELDIESVVILGGEWPTVEPGAGS